MSLYIQKEKYKKYRYEGDYTLGYFESNEILGYSPLKDTVITSKRFYEDHLIYDVKYSIGKDGLRKSSNDAINIKEENCILFFGGSFTFGEGVDDTSSMPYIVSLIQSLPVHNFGFHGYGPHQMLSAIENNIIHCKPKYAIYQSLSVHVGRANGFSSWDKHGPRYVLHNGIINKSGHFDDKIKENENGIFITKLKRSYWYQKFFFGKDRYIIKDEHIATYLGIIDHSKNLLKSKFPGIEFHVITWDVDEDDKDDNIAKILSGFEKRSIKYHKITEIIPKLKDNPNQYFLSKYDYHPNPKSHSIIANYISDNILLEE